MLFLQALLMFKEIYIYIYNNNNNKYIYIYIIIARIIMCNFSIKKSCKRSLEQISKQ